MRFLLGSLQVKIILLIGIVVSVILIVFSSFTLQLLKNHAMESITESRELLARGLDASIETKRRLGDPELLKREVKVITDSQLGVDEIYIFSFTPKKTYENVLEMSPEKKGTKTNSTTKNKNRERTDYENIRIIIPTETTTSFYLSEKAENTLLQKDTTYQEIEGNLPGPRYLNTYFPLHLSKKVIGGIYVRSSLVNLDKTLSYRQKYFAETTLVTVVILIIAISLIMQWMVARPVKRLVGGMQKVEAGDLSGKVISRRKDELGRLTLQYNQMVSRLAESSKRNEQLLSQIELFNKELQSRVEETTAELKLRNQQLSDANERLISMQRRLWETERLATLGQVAATIAHEIGTPLGAISGHIQLLKSNESVIPETQHRLELIDKQIGRVVNTVQQMLDSVRARTPEKKPVNVKEVLDNVLFLLAPQFTDGKVHVKVNIPTELPPILMNTDALYQLFLNLFTNAMDAMPDGGELSVIADTITTAETFFPNKVEICVADTGEGISPEVLSKIFDPFFTTKPPGKGTGLGLAVCKDIVERYNGTLSVQSEPGKGTTFSLKFPV
jgi:signal transduction histidine kinase